MNLATLYNEKRKAVKRAPWLTATDPPPTLTCVRMRFPGCRLSLLLPAPGRARAVPDGLAARRLGSVVLRRQFGTFTQSERRRSSRLRKRLTTKLKMPSAFTTPCEKFAPVCFMALCVSG